MMPWWTWIITGASLIGTVLNARKNIKCFYIWLGSNSAWAIYDFTIGEYSQAALFAIYVGLAIYGIREWKK
jgi:nicotinamide riboside transporter PnuC